MPYGPISTRMMLEVGKIFSAPSPTGTTSGVKEYYTVVVGSVPQWSLDPAKDTPRWSPDSVLAEYRKHCVSCSQLENRIGVEETEATLQTMLLQKGRIRKLLMKSLAVDAAVLDKIEREAEEASYVSFYSAPGLAVEPVPASASLLPMSAEDIFGEAEAVLEEPGYSCLCLGSALPPLKKSKR